MGLKVAIVGLSRSTHEQAPWDNHDWQIWGLPWDEGYWPRMSRLFEMHDIKLLRSAQSKRPDGYMGRLRHEIDVPLYMQDKYFLNATRFPFEEVAETIGKPYWNSSIAYALSLAIHEKAEEIAIYGVDMAAEEEFFYQRPNIEYLIGLAVGKGIKVTIPEASPLCKFNAFGVRYYDSFPVYAGRYGYLGE